MNNYERKVQGNNSLPVAIITEKDVTDTKIECVFSSVMSDVLHEEIGKIFTKGVFYIGRRMKVFNEHVSNQ